MRHLARLWVVLPLALAGCGSTGPKFAPACPQAGVLPGAGDFTHYAGTGRDLTDLVLDGRITGVQGTCKPGDNGTVVATVRVQMTMTRGPSAPSRTVEVPYFVAIAEGENILDKQEYVLRSTFPSNQDAIGLTSPALTFTVPVSKDRSAAAFKIWAAFQLTPEEWQRVRAH